MYTQVPLHVQASKPLNYRMRAEFRVWHVGDKCHFAHFDPQTKKPIFVEQYPLACERINELMRDLQEAMSEEREQGEKMIRHKLLQVEFVASTSGEALVCLVYQKKIDDAWMAAAQKLETKLGERGLKCHVIGRSKGKKLVVGGEHVVQWQEVHGRKYPQWQTENKFSQSNADICNAMQHWVLDQVKGPDGRRASDILEVACDRALHTHTTRTRTHTHTHIRIHTHTHTHTQCVECVGMHRHSRPVGRSTSRSL